MRFTHNIYIFKLPLLDHPLTLLIKYHFKYHSTQPPIATPHFKYHNSQPTIPLTQQPHTSYITLTLYNQPYYQLAPPDVHRLPVILKLHLNTQITLV